jgi:hypothetical protein
MQHVEVMEERRNQQEISMEHSKMEGENQERAVSWSQQKRSLMMDQWYLC